MALPNATTAITGLTQTGYYSHFATAYDAAGNSASITLAAGRTIVYDAPVPVVGAAQSPVTVTGLGWTSTAFVNDALDIQTIWFSGDYSTSTTAPKRFAQAQSAVNGWNAASFVNTNYAVSQTINLPLALQANMAATLYLIDGMEVNAINQGNLLTSGVSAALGAGFTTPAGLTAISTAIMTAFTTPTNSIASNNISSGVSTAATAGNPATGTLTVTATGPTATFNLPFSRVDFYAANSAGAEYRLIGSAAASGLVDVGSIRTFTWNLPISGATLYTQLSYTATQTTPVIAIGYNASGTVGMITAPYTLNIIK